MLLTPLGILRILNLICVGPEEGVGVGTRGCSVLSVEGYAFCKWRPVLLGLMLPGSDVGVISIRA